MAEPIEAGLLSGFMNWLKGSSKGLATSMDSLIKLGMQVRDAKKAEEGGFIFEAKGGSNHVVKVKCIPLPEREGRFDVFIKNKEETIKDPQTGEDKPIKSQIKEYHDVTPDKFDDVITEFFDKVFGEGLEDGFHEAKKHDREQNEDANFDVNPEPEEGEDEGVEENTNSSKILQIGVRPITGSKKMKVKLTAVKANYDFSEALTDVHELIENPDFAESLDTDDESYWEVQVENDGMMIDPCAEFSKEDCTILVLKSAWKAWNACYKLMYSVHNPGYADAYGAIQDARYTLDTQIQSLTDSIMTTVDCLPDPYDLIGQPSGIPAGPIAGKGALMYVEVYVREYLDVLELYYVDLPATTQAECGYWIKWWKNFIDYRLARLME